MAMLQGTTPLYIICNHEFQTSSLQHLTANYLAFSDSGCSPLHRDLSRPRAERTEAPQADQTPRPSADREAKQAGAGKREEDRDRLPGPAVSTLLCAAPRASSTSPSTEWAAISAGAASSNSSCPPLEADETDSRAESAAAPEEDTCEG